jgi:NTE family protein
MQRFILQVSDGENGGITYAASAPPITNLIMEGGGERGEVYPGAIKVLEEQGKMQQIQRIGGSSAGALSAVILALGNSADEFADIGKNLKLTDLVDTKATLESVKNFFLGRGVLSGDSALNEVRQVVRTKVEAALKKYPSLTDLNIDLERVSFRNLHDISARHPDLGMKELFIVGTNKSAKDSEIFCNDKTPDMEIATAARISMSIPVLYQTVENKGAEYEDGGCLQNYAMNMFDKDPYLPQSKYCLGSNGQNLCTLGLKVDTAENMQYLLWHNKQAEENTLGSIKDKAAGILNNIEGKVADLLTGVSYTKAAREEDERTKNLFAQRTIQICDMGASTTDFGMSDDKKQLLTKSGRDATKQWFNVHLQELYFIGAAKNFQDLVNTLPVIDLAFLCKNLKAGVVKVDLPPTMPAADTTQLLTLAENKYREHLKNMKSDPAKDKDLKACQAIYTPEPRVKIVVLSTRAAIIRQLEKSSHSVPKIQIIPQESKVKTYEINVRAFPPVEIKAVFVIPVRGAVNSMPEILDGRIDENAQCRRKI